MGSCSFLEIPLQIHSVHKLKEIRDKSCVHSREFSIISIALKTTKQLSFLFTV